MKLTQSISILEYLEERYPEKPLLPKDLKKRAIVRNLVNIISCDVQPITNLRILIHVEKLGSSRADWAKEYLQTGLNGTCIFCVIENSVRDIGEGLCRVILGWGRGYDGGCCTCTYD